MEILGGNFLRAIAEVVDILLSVYIWLIVGRAILSWVNPDPYNPIVRFLYSATEPFWVLPEDTFLPSGAR